MRMYLYRYPLGTLMLFFNHLCFDHVSLHYPLQSRLETIATRHGMWIKRTCMTVHGHQHGYSHRGSNKQRNRMGIASYFFPFIHLIVYWRYGTGSTAGPILPWDSWLKGCIPSQIRLESWRQQPIRHPMDWQRECRAKDIRTKGMKGRSKSKRICDPWHGYIW